MTRQSKLPRVACHLHPDRAATSLIATCLQAVVAGDLWCAESVVGFVAIDSRQGSHATDFVHARLEAQWAQHNSCFCLSEVSGDEEVDCNQDAAPSRYTARSTAQAHANRCGATTALDRSLADFIM